MENNIVVIDSCKEEGTDFIRGLMDSTGEDWDIIVKHSNDRKTKAKEMLRYLKYFYEPFFIFLKRKKYKNIVAWQQFYGIIFAFYCRLFRVKKVNNLIVMTFIYKEKNGLIGKLYNWFIRYVVTSDYVDAFISVTSLQCSVQRDMFAKEFGVPEEKFKFIPWGIADLAPTKEHLRREQEPYFFCAGRSNRDWKIVFDSFGNSKIACKFICSDTSYSGKYKNIDVFSNVSDEEYYSNIVNSYCVVISVDNCNISGGEITMINAMQFGKPIILIQDTPHSDYIIEGVNGYIVPKNKERILEVANKLISDYELREAMAKNARKLYEEKFTVYSVGQAIGKLICSF